MASTSCCLPFPLFRPADKHADIIWMLRLKTGDDRAMEALFQRHQRGIYGYLFRMVQNGAAAEELTQEVFLRVYLARHNYEASAKFTTWLYQIATNLALNWVRDHRRDRNTANLEDAAQSPPARILLRITMTPEGILLRQELTRRVQEAVAELPERQRAVILLHKYGDMEYTEIAEATGFSVSAVKALVNRAYTTLRARLSNETTVRV